MAIFVPPAVFDEVKTVFHLPVIANIGLQLRLCDVGWVEAGCEITTVSEGTLTVGRTYFTIGAEDDLTTRKV